MEKSVPGDVQMRELKGTHGTTNARAEGILQEGFCLSPVGRAGKGVYFWQYFRDPEIARGLAVGWYQQQMRRGAYGDDKSECAIIDACFEVDDDDILDCTGEIEEQVAIMLQKLSERSEDDISYAYDSIIGQVEKLRGKPILVAKAHVTPPKISFPFKQIVPYPPVLAVRSEAVKIEAKVVT